MTVDIESFLEKLGFGLLLKIVSRYKTIILLQIEFILALLFFLFYVQKIDADIMQRVKSIGINGIEFYENVRKIEDESLKNKDLAKDTVAFSVELEDKLKSLSLRFSNLEERIGHTQVDRNMDDVGTDIATTVVSELNKKSLELSSGQSSKTQNNAKEGYIFIGNYSGNSWQKTYLIYPDSKKKRLNKPPSEIVPSEKYITYGDMNLRQTQPGNGPSYFYASKLIGLIGRGTNITILEKPVGFERGGVIQYWARIRAE
ncbi:MAG: hypothetical protein HQL77_02400 [Magnetococcales bacterium]|nr:hypothetical protein [Magnetococcales bacterium]